MFIKYAIFIKLHLLINLTTLISAPENKGGKTRESKLKEKKKASEELGLLGSAILSKTQKRAKVEKNKNGKNRA